MVSCSQYEYIVTYQLLFLTLISTVLEAKWIKNMETLYVKYALFIPF